MTSMIASAVLASSLVAGTTAFKPLVDQIFPYADVPYQVDTDPSGRGPQAGYTRCNSTTAGPDSLCQLSMINSIQDFCLWGASKPNSLIMNIEGETVAWCTQADHGSRVMPKGTITGVQFLKAPAYVAVVGTINQQNIDLDANDSGGELDPHGADLRGNPLGGLVYSNAFPSNGGNLNNYQQVIEWHNFMGSQQFCFKACDPSVPNSAQYCNNLYDRTGCNFVAPAAYQEGVFEVCDSDNQDPVGVYTGADGKTSTYHQPPEGTPINTLPNVKIPKTSNCKTYASSTLFDKLPAYTGGSSAATASSSSKSGKSSGLSTSTSTGSSSAASATGPAGFSHSVASLTLGFATSATPSPSGSTGAAFRQFASNDVVVGMIPVIAVGLSLVAGFGAVLVGL